MVPRGAERGVEARGDGAGVDRGGEDGEVEEWGGQRARRGG